MNYIEEFCDRIAILNNGSVAIQGDINEIKRNYVRDKLVARSDQAGEILTELGACCTKKEDGSLLIQLKSEGQKQEMMKRLTEAYDIDEIKVFEPSLNDIFVEHAGDHV